MAARRSTRAGARTPRGGAPPEGPRESAPQRGDVESGRPGVHLRSATRHPFIFERMIRSVDPGARPGDVVDLFDKKGAYFGRGLYNPRSRIAVRVLTYSDQSIDDAFWRQALLRAIDLRRRLEIDAVTDAYRLVHAEGDGLSGLIVERYADCLVLELFSIGMYHRVMAVCRPLGELLGRPRCLDRPDAAADQWRFLVRADERIQQLEGFRLNPKRFDLSPAPAHVIVREHGLRYRVDLAAGHKTGFFCDQRDNRRRFASLCRGEAVLDLCCYSGGFGLCAKLLGGATEVTCVDLDEAAVAQAQANAHLNQTRLSVLQSDAFTYLRQMIANACRFGAVVLDPPKLALARSEVRDALRKYHDLNALALQAVRSGGMFLTCSCSGLVSRERFEEAVHHAARAVGRSLQRFEATGAAPDHPVMANCPESEYLKALWYRVF